MKIISTLTLALLLASTDAIKLHKSSVNALNKTDDDEKAAPAKEGAAAKTPEDSEVKADKEADKEAAESAEAKKKNDEEIEYQRVKALNFAPFPSANANPETDWENYYHQESFVYRNDI